MLTSVNYDSAQGLEVRLRRSDGAFYNFTLQQWDVSDTADCRQALSEFANGDGTSLYIKSVALPAGGPFAQEIVDTTDAVIASGEASEPSGVSLADIEASTVLAKESTAQAIYSTVTGIATVTDPLATIVPGSEPPMTRGEAIDQLYIPAYVGPVIAIPANTDPAVQFVHVFGVKGDGAKSAKREVTASPLPGQIEALNLIDKEIRKVTLDDNGYGHLTLLKGVAYQINVGWWRQPLEILVSSEDNANLVDYAMEDLTSLQSVLGSIRFGDKYIRPVLTDQYGATVPIGTITSLDGLTIGWEIV